MSLREERKALVERYMIDAEEAEARAQREAEEQARRDEAATAAAVARARARREAEEQARRDEAEAAARARAEREAEEQARREEAEAAARARTQQAEPEVVPDTVGAAAHTSIDGSLPEDEAPPTTDDRGAHPDPGEATEDLPVYGWLERVVPTPPDAADWPRELVKAREARGDTPGTPDLFG